MKRLCVFCGSNRGAHPEYEQAAVNLGQTLAAQGIGLVYGGGNVGLMGALANSVLAAGGEAIGVIPTFLRDKELAHSQLTQLHVVDSMHTRKAMMADMADGFIALPGGLGTFEELFEVASWAQLGMHNKPIGLLNVADFYTPLLALLDTAARQGFMREQHVGLMLADSDADTLLARMRAYQPASAHKWLDRAAC
ncbi:MAG: hypothetical protein RI925_306 [Pseudomonadota bacterium]|jgi:uncharacterized protein (TIGR00730 family)